MYYYIGTEATNPKRDETMNDLNWDDYFDNDRESGGEFTPDANAPERLDDKIVRLSNAGLTVSQIADESGTVEKYVILVVQWSK